MMGMPPQMMAGGMRGGQNFPPQRGGMGGRPGQMQGYPQQRGGMAPMGGASQQGAPGVDMNQLSSAPPQQQKQMLGEALYPKIHEQQPELAGKITGMLLEMDNQELIALTSDDNALRAKVDEAMNVYNEYLKSRNDGADDSGAMNGGEGANAAGEDAEQKA